MTNEIYNQIPDTIVELFQIDIMNTNIYLQKKEYNKQKIVSKHFCKQCVKRQ